MSGEMLQTLLVGLIVLAAAAYVGRRFWRTVAVARVKKDAAGGSCGSGCGCSHE